MNVKEISYEKSDILLNKHLELLISKSDTIFINTIRRICLDDIPYYAFSRDGITITENTSIYDNDYMKTRLSQLPIFNIDCPFDHLTEKTEDKKKIELYINKYNETTENINVSTNDVKILVDGNEFEMYPKKHPILLIKLRPNETFKCHMISKIGIGETDNIFCPISNIYFKEVKEGIMLIIDICENNPYEILIKACNCLKYRLKTFIDNVDLKDEKEIELILENEDMTICNLLNNELQEHKDILFSGVNQPNHLKKECVMKINSKKSILPAVNDCFKSLSNKISTFENKLKTLIRKH